MAGKLEIERKYELPDGFAMPDLTGVGGVAAVGEPDDQRLDAVYYDTAELHLARGRVTLRRRTGGNDAGWHLKRPAGGERSELQVPANKTQRVPPRAIADQVRALTRGEALAPVARIRTHRVERALRAADGRTLALLADDTVSTESLQAGGGAREWHELEVELVDGDTKALERLDAALRKAGARPSKSASKLQQALGPDYPLAPEAPGSALAAYLAAQRDALIEQDPQVRDGDAEAVHKMRVATRRLRSTLRSFAPMLTGDLDALHEEVKWVTGLLGAVRDTDVMGERLDHLVHAEPAELVLGPVAARITSLLAAQAAEARKALTAGLDSPRYTALLNDIDALVARTGPAPRKRLMRLARKAQRRADGRLDAATSDAEMHESRKAYKRARYAAELVAPVAGKPATALADRITDLQDALGTHQDAMVTGELLKAYGITAYGAGENAFTYGLLHARIDEQGRRALEDLPRVRRRARKAARALYG
ncbi:CYTH and CHAD domain-containing protein [Dactylosporangium vinaceum]|uniref:CHAD domain-containing protein n=1 Tax=Dactylosporangium vinaceum TaxID=53362 RepID=A0ABV5MGG8_9ACTN|nr:CYTH and CHAD domain-containing protein [Dactylosporangium vinaceum]UAB99074.1 CYTH and CHAD domain-containing protein [Dactylosporangium vinaceum]